MRVWMKKFLSTAEAHIAIETELGDTISYPTLIDWIRKYEIGYKIGGRWRVDRIKLKSFLKGGNENKKKKTQKANN